MVAGKWGRGRPHPDEAHLTMVRFVKLRFVFLGLVALRLSGLTGEGAAHGGRRLGCSEMLPLLW